MLWNYSLEDLHLIISFEVISWFFLLLYTIYLMLILFKTGAKVFKDHALSHNVCFHRSTCLLYVYICKSKSQSCMTLYMFLCHDILFLCCCFFLFKYFIDILNHKKVWNGVTFLFRAFQRSDAQIHLFI